MIQTTVEIVALEQEAKALGQSLKKDLNFLIEMTNSFGTLESVPWRGFDPTKWFIYKGGHHVSVHARYADGALGKRLVMFVDSTCCSMCKEIVK